MLALGVAAQASTPTTASADDQSFGADEIPDQIYWTLEDLIAEGPAPWPSQAISDEMMQKYANDPSFVSVYLDAPDAVRVVLKGGPEESFETQGISVTMVRAKYSLAELLEQAESLRSYNPKVHEVEVVADEQRLVAAIAPVDSSARASMDVGRLPSDVAVDIILREPAVLDAAEGAKLVTGNGCTSGFRMNGNRMSTASHCGNSWGTINGVSMTHRSSLCTIDNQWASGSSLSTQIGSYSWTGSQFDPGSGSLVYKYGRVTGWTYGYAGNYASVGISCPITALTYTGGNMASIGGDSGGPYITTSFVDGVIKYIARGTHRGRSGSTMHSMPMSQINSKGWYVG